MRAINDYYTPNIMALFSSKILITSDTDLRHYLKKHKKAFRLTQNGNLILAIDQLSSIPKPTLLNRKTGIIINTLRSDDDIAFGHWVLLLISKNRKCLFIDSLASTFHSDKHLQSMIIAFCAKHTLKLFIWRVKSQTEKSQSCGFQILFFLHFFSKYNIEKFCKLKQLLKSFSVKQAELYILQRAYTLCA